MTTHHPRVEVLVSNAGLTNHGMGRSEPCLVITGDTRTHFPGMRVQDGVEVSIVKEEEEDDK